MPRKWGKADYDDDYDDYEEDYDYEEEKEVVAPAAVQPAHTSVASAGERWINTKLPLSKLM